MGEWQMHDRSHCRTAYMTSHTAQHSVQCESVPFRRESRVQIESKSVPSHKTRAEDTTKGRSTEHEKESWGRLVQLTTFPPPKCDLCSQTKGAPKEKTEKGERKKRN